MELFTCKKCGGGLIEQGDYYVCPSCGARYTNDGARKYRDELRNALGEAFYEEKQEQLANLRRLLWKETHEKFSDGDAIKDVCRKIRELVPDDAAAEFYYSVSDGKSKRINKFLQSFNIEEDPEYVEDFILYTIKSLRKENIVFLHAFWRKRKTRAFFPAIGISGYWTSWRRKRKRSKMAFTTSICHVRCSCCIRARISTE